jgi:N-acetylmuramoyl-L-alanine amidase
MRRRRVVLWLVAAAVLATVVSLGYPVVYARLFLNYPLHHRTFPAAIVIHHSVTPPMLHGKVVDAAVLDAMHAARGFAATGPDGKVYHIGYHYVVLQDGTVQPGRPESLWGQHTHDYNETLGICLVGNFQSTSNHGQMGPLVPPPAQLAAAARLARQLLTRYGLTRDDIFLHRELAATECPGDCFPKAAFLRLVDHAPPSRP